MELVEVVGPDLATLRPLHPEARTATFPVHQELASTLVQAAAHPDDVAAHVLAACAGYAYAEASTVAMMMARLGLDENHCLMISETVDSMFICSRAFVVQSKCGRVAILCYRGTEPVNLVNWLTDADTSPVGVSFFSASSRPCDLHAGFYRNVRATRYEVVRALERAMKGESVLPTAGQRQPPPHPLEALYVTGHSLGGAMAATMGVMLATEPDYARLVERLKGVYTYGQPMIGDAALAEASTAFDGRGQHLLRDRLIRYVYRGDPVPALPPLVAGDYAHFGREILLEVEAGRFRASEQRVPTQQMFLAESVQLLPAIFASATRFRDVSFRYAPGDHGPQNYIAALTPPSVHTTEFGDDALTPIRVPASRLASAIAFASQAAANVRARATRCLTPFLTGAHDQVRRLGAARRGAATHERSPAQHDAAGGDQERSAG